ncbi:MAG: two-component system LytT family response regulator [Myxococcota bacterium]|jgi:two-component system LytT family response regulator
MTSLRVLIADDESMARRRLRRLLEPLVDVIVVGECSDGVEVLEAVAEEPIDLVLLDIQMPRLTGVEALAAMGSDGPHVVFTTAHPEHAVAAWDGGAIDYLLKPVELGRLRKALDRVLSARSTVVPERPPERLAVETRKGVVLLQPSEIVRAVLDGQSLVLHTDRGAFFVSWRLAELEARLPKTGFVRVHRRGLVQLDRVERFEPVDSGGYLAHCDDGGVVEVSRQIARQLRREWGL